MIYNIYSVRDSKVGFASPFIDSFDESAKRGFYYAFSQNSSLISFAPSDFSLYKIGEFNSDSGEISSILPVYICCASDFIAVKDGVEDEK